MGGVHGICSGNQLELSKTGSTAKPVPLVASPRRVKTCPIYQVYETKPFILKKTPVTRFLLLRQNIPGKCCAFFQTKNQKDTTQQHIATTSTHHHTKIVHDNDERQRFCKMATDK
jgi:hypothetical protein